MPLRPETAVNTEPVALPSLRRGLLSWRTLLPLALVVAGFALALPHRSQSFSGPRVAAALAGANVWLLLVGLVAFYGSFLLRTIHWHVLLLNVGTGEPERPVRCLLETLYLSWYANVLVPADGPDALPHDQRL